MSDWFWKSCHRARRSYFCDRCFHDIVKGERYIREVWVPGRGRFNVMRWHTDPECDFERDPFEEPFEITTQAVIQEQNVLAFKIEERLVLKIGTDGRTIVATETHLTSHLVPQSTVHESWFDDDDSDEFPF